MCVNSNAHAPQQSPMPALWTKNREGPGNPLYTDYAITSPDVPIIREDAGALLAAPYWCTIITAPGPNARVVLKRDPSRRDEVLAATTRRIDKVLRLVADAEATHLVLGAWGCGAFGGESEEVARRFDEALRGPHAGVFERVVFAVLDNSKDERFLGPFRRRFG